MNFTPGTWTRSGRSLLIACATAALGLANAPARGIELTAGDALGVLAEGSIVRIDPDGGTEPIFSAAAAGLQTLYAITVERNGHVLALALGGGSSLVRVDPATGGHQQVALLPAIGLPFSMSLDRAGAALFLIDYSGDLFRVDLATNTVSTVAALASDGTASFAIAMAPDGSLYVSDDAQDTLLRVDPSTGASQIVAEGIHFGGFYRAHGIDVDHEGRILGTRYEPAGVLRVDPVSGAEEVVAEGGLLENPVEIEIDRDGAVLVANLWTGTVVRIDLETGEQTQRDTPYLLTGLALVPYPECDDGRDDDGDGLVDWPADPGCANAAARNESPACQDGIDNDGQRGTDFDGGASANGGVALDVPDPQCVSPWSRERSASCGIGCELVGLLGLSGLRRFREASSP